MSEKIVEKPFKNIIDDRNKKEETGDLILKYLTNQNLINMKKDLNYLTLEFGYLFQDNDNNIVALVKVQTAGGLFKKKKTFFVGYQQNNLMLLGNGFNDILFRKTSDDMLKMHNVDMSSLNKKSYFMQLYK